MYLADSDIHFAMRHNFNPNHRLTLWLRTVDGSLSRMMPTIIIFGAQRQIMTCNFWRWSLNVDLDEEFWILNIHSGSMPLLLTLQLPVLCSVFT